METGLRDDCQVCQVGLWCRWGPATWWYRPGQALLPCLVPADRGTEAQHDHAWGGGEEGGSQDLEVLSPCGGTEAWGEPSRMGAGEQTKQDLGVREETSPARPCPARPRVGCLSSHAGCKEQQLGSTPPPPPRAPAYATSVTSASWHIIPSGPRPWTGRRPLTFHAGALPTRLRSAPSNDPRGERDAPPPDSLQHVGRGARGAGPGAHSCGPELLRLRGATGRGQAPGG